MIQSFDSTFVESNVISGAKPFQKATIERVDYLFQNGKRRVLVADEVGLGKTVVARGVLARMASRWKEEGKGIFKVAYICANQNIVSQNLISLMKGFEEFTNGDSSGTRLSMLPLVAELQERELSKDGIFIQIIPITPETSFRMGNRSGLADERAIIFSMLKALPGFAMSCALSEMLRGSVKKVRWHNLTKDYDKQIRTINEADSQFLENFKSTFNFLGGFKVTEQLGNHVGKNGDGIRELRKIFAKIGSQRLHPHLVILDEFQRFRYLIDPPKREGGGEVLTDPPKGKDGGEVKMLFDKFLRDDDKETDRPFVLMLSATPFKLNSTRKEDANNGRPVSYEEFKGVLEFLFGKGGHALEKCDNYSKALFEFAHSKTEDSASLADALSTKKDVEEALREGICRTERTLVEPLGQSDNSSPGPLLPDSHEIQSFHHYSQWAKSIGADNRLRVEYAKSAPYLLSFLTGYDEQKQLEKVLKSKPEVLKNRKTPKEVRKSLWISENKDVVRGYKRIDWANRRLELLAKHAFAENTEEQPFNPENLLWIPPTMPCYPLAGPFAESAGYSKVLVFSSWQMVPKMAAVLLSYETERRTIAKMPRKRGEKLNYFKKERFPEPMLRFRSNGRGSSPDTMSPDTMSLFTLLYPSKTLAGLFSSVEALNARCESAKSAATEIARKLRDMLVKYKDPQDGDPDIKWYYLAPMLLDYSEGEGAKTSEGEDAKTWCDDALEEWKKKGNKKKFKGASAALDALKRDLEALEAGKTILGRRPDDLYEVLADMALGSPAVCLRRAGTDAAIATRLAEAFRNFFNSPEAIAAVECNYSRSNDSHEKNHVLEYCKNVLRYGRDGCLQSVLDEYLHLLSPGKSLSVPKENWKDKDTKEAINAIESALSFRSAPYKIDTFEALKARVSAIGGEGVGGDGSEEKTEKNEKADKKMSMRTHFAAAVADGDGGGDDEKAVNRVESLRYAFNSPFRPFVLASTSIGQEGLDFHWYCRKVFHWNLPHNPVDLEQREGRVDRYRGLVVRQNVADQFKDKRDFSKNKDIWTQLFEAAEKKAEADDPSGLIPNWRNGPDAPWKIERIVPLYSCSVDESEYERITQLLARYRMAIGQPQQEDLLKHFLNVDLETIRSFFLNLCPFSSQDPHHDQM